MPPVAGMRRLLAAEATSNFGSMLSRLALPWLAALQLAATPLGLSGLVIADVVAGAVGSLLLGGFVDRANKRVVMVTADCLRALATLTIVVLLLAGVLEFWMLVVAAAASGVLSLVFSLARSAWMAEQVPSERLTTANAQMSAATSTSESVAFAGGGYIYQLAGPALALGVDALSYIASACLLRGVPTQPNPVRGPEGAVSLAARWQRLRTDASGGMRVVMADPTLRILAQCGVLVALTYSMSGATYMYFVTSDLLMPTGWQGLIYATGALGALAGATMAPALARRFGSMRAMAFGLLAAGIGALLVPLAPGAALAGVLLLVGHQIIGDAGSALAAIHDRTLRQQGAPAASRARVDAALRVFAQVATLVGALIGGALGSAISARVVLFLGALMMLAAGLLALAATRRLTASTA